MFHLRNLTSTALPELPLHILTWEARSSHGVCIHEECQAISNVFLLLAEISTFALLTAPKSWLCGHNKLWKIHKEMGIPDHLTCLLRNLYAGQEAAVRTGRGTTNWFQIGQGCKLSSCLFNLYTEYIMKNADVLDGWNISWNQDWREKYPKLWFFQ